MLFRRNKLDKLKPTRELDNESPETPQILKNQGNSGQHVDSYGKTLDDIGIPPPPPSFSKDKKKMQDDDIVAEYDEVDSKKDDLVPFSSAVHESSEAELPSDYEERVNELDSMMHRRKNNKKSKSNSKNTQSKKKSASPTSSIKNKNSYQKNAKKTEKKKMKS